MAGRIFISYRRADSGEVCGRMYDRLEKRFGRFTVFKDVDSIAAGDDFPKELRRALEQSSVALIVIGRSWLTIGEATSRRLDDPGDYVRQEVELALALAASGRLQVIPVLVQGARLPRAEELPPSLTGLARREPVTVRGDPEFHRDMDRLIGAIVAGMKAPRTRRMPLLLQTLRTAHPFVAWSAALGLVTLAANLLGTLIVTNDMFAESIVGDSSQGLLARPAGVVVYVLQFVCVLATFFAMSAAIVVAGQTRQWEWLTLIVLMVFGAFPLYLADTSGQSGPVSVPRAMLEVGFLVGILALMLAFGTFGSRLTLFRLRRG